MSALVVTLVLPGWASAEPAGPAAATALAAVDALPPTPNTAWGIDPATGQLMVTIARGAPAAGVARLLAVADGFGDAVRVVHSGLPFTEADLPGPFSPDDSDGVLLGGDAISDGKIICSAGFIVLRHSKLYVLTAGHCTAGLPDWQDVGPSAASEFPGTDYGLIADEDSYARGDVDLYDGTAQPITSVGTPTVGEQVCASGQTTQVTCGSVLAVGQTVDYGDGHVVHGLVKTNVHTDHGDSGGPLFDGPAGLGVVSGGDGTIDYFQPIAPAMRAYDLRLPLP